MSARSPRRVRLPVVLNHRGVPVGVWLGTVVVLALVGGISAIVLGELAIERRLTGWARHLLWIGVGLVVVYMAGFYDDVRPEPTRGIVRQIGLLRYGRVSPGVVKLVAIVAASALVAWALGLRGARLVLGIGVVAACANLWNLVDVIPGRALKFFLPAAAALGFLAPVAEYRALAVISVAVGAIALLLDLREVAMLGDSGSNPLGFVVGLGLLLRLPLVGLAVALVLLVVAHVFSETVTLSRIIRAVPPLRWFDELGRIRPAHGSDDGRAVAPSG